ncbi:MAG: hypothetical protein J6Y63_09115 [Bacteroidales bacterium]|nr:hypothetical protein [Bacteroidales bacterium]
MKKAIILLCVVAGILSCTKEPKGPQEPAADTPMTFEISVAETKAAKDAWADGDQIYVFFHGLATKFLILERSSGSWTYMYGKETITAEDFNGLETKKLTAVHFPFQNVMVTYSDNKFTFTKNSKPIYNYYLYETDKAYTVSGTTVTVTLSLRKPDDIALFHVKGLEGTQTDYTFACPFVVPVACTSVGLDGKIDRNRLQAGARLSGIADSDGAIFAGRLSLAGLSTNYNFTFASDTKLYTYTKSLTLAAGYMYNIELPASLTGDSGWTVQNASDLYVDMGSVGKWAKCNLGASSETDYGNYYAWGELQPKSAYGWDNYLWANGVGTKLTKYCNDSAYGDEGFTDGLTVLQLEDDAAYAALGGMFRMPSNVDIINLVATFSSTLPPDTGYTWTWCDGSTTKYNETTVKGWKIEYNSTHATLFLPAAGCREITSPISEGEGGRYWSSSINSTHWNSGGPDEALNIYTNNIQPSRMSQKRYLGFSIRPIYTGN